MCKQNNLVTWPRLLSIFCLIVGMFFLLSLNQPPILADVADSFPQDGSTTFGIDDTLIIYFEEEIDANSVNNNTVTLKNRVGITEIPVSLHNFRQIVSGGKTVLFIDPVYSLQYDTEYTLSLVGLEDRTQKSINDFELKFTTIKYPNERLAIIHADPVNDAQNVPINKQVILTFNKYLDLSSVNDNTIFLTDSTGQHVEITFVPNNSTHANKLTIIPKENLAYLSTYTVNIKNAGVYAVKDLSGQTMPATTLQFTTIAAGGPSLTNQSPAPYSSNVSVDVILTFTFSQDMNASTLNSSSIYLQKDGSGIVPASYSYNPSTRMLILTPHRPLESVARYNVYATAVAKGTNTLSLSPSNWYFNTSIAGTSSNPINPITPVYPGYTSIIERDPEANSNGVPIDKTVKFRFNTSVDPSSINSSTVYLTRSGSQVTASVSYDSYYKQVSISPYNHLNNNSQYIVNVNGVMDSYGNYISASSWSFYTGYLYSSGSSERYPAANASGVPLDTVIRYRFASEMNSSTIDTSNISLTRGGSYVSINVSYDPATRWVSITPSSNLRTGSEYTVHLSSNIRDSHGNYIPGISWSFSTSNYYRDYYDNYDNRYYYDYYRPGILSRDPSPYSTGIALDKIIRVRFDKDMNSSTINSNNVYLRQAGTTISARVSYDSSSRSLTISPSDKLRPNTEYTVNLSSSIRDYNGNYFAGDSWSFTTAATSSSNYSHVYSNVSTGRPGQPLVVLNGQRVVFADVQPYIKNGRTLLPYRALLEMLGADISWEPNLQRVTASLNGNVIQLTIGKKTATVNNQTILLDVAPEIKNSRTMIPLRFVSESLGFNTYWDAAAYTVYLTN